jgi:hypothetical protein
MEPSTMAALASGAGAVLSGIGGLTGGSDFSMSDYREQLREQYWLNHDLAMVNKNIALGFDARKIVRAKNDAIAAGLHPLAALGINPSGGGASAPGISAGIMSSGETSDMDAMGQALSGAGSAYLKYRQEKEQQEINALQKARLSAEISETKARTEGINVDTLQKSRDFVENSARAAVAAKNMRTVQNKPALRQFVTPWGSSWNVGSGTPAQDWEDQYSEVPGFLFGTGNLFKDLGQNYPALSPVPPIVQPAVKALNYIQEKPRHYGSAGSGGGF